MIQTAETISSTDAQFVPSCGYEESNWYAAYTSPRHEKRVADQLSQLRVEHLLPLYVARRQWKDRQKLVEFPLFPGYVFVQLQLKNKMRVLDVPGIIRLVGFHGLPSSIPENEIEGLRAASLQSARVQPYPYSKMTEGRRVRVKDGPFSGLEGKLVRRKGSVHVILSIEMIQRSLLVDVDISSVEFCGVAKRS